MNDEMRPVDGDDPSTKVEFNPLVPKLVIELEGVRGEFLAKPRINQVALLRVGKAEATGNESHAAAATYDMITNAIKKEDRERFEEFWMEYGTDEEAVQKAMEGLRRTWAGETNLPLVPTSSDSSPSTSATNSRLTENSSEPGTDEVSEGVNSNSSLV